jgi:hypothetical protein
MATRPLPNTNIADVLIVGNLVVVRIDDGQTRGPRDESMNRSVLAFNQDANLAWAIQEARHGDDEWPIKLPAHGSALTT